MNEFVVLVHSLFGLLVWWPLTWDLFSYCLFTFISFSAVSICWTLIFLIPTYLAYIESTNSSIRKRVPCGFRPVLAVANYSWHRALAVKLHNKFLAPLPRNLFLSILEPVTGLEIRPFFLFLFVVYLFFFLLETVYAWVVLFCLYTGGAKGAKPLSPLIQK